MLPSLRPSYYQPVTQQSILQSELISGLESRPKNTILGMKFCHRKTKIITLKVILFFIQLYIRRFYVVPCNTYHTYILLQSLVLIPSNNCCWITLATYKKFLESYIHVRRSRYGSTLSYNPCMEMIVLVFVLKISSCYLSSIVWK